MLRITRDDMEDGNTTLHLEGRVTEHEMEVLLQTCGECLREDRRLALDLAAVFFVDLAGVRAIRDLQARGAVLNFSGCSPFVTELLKEASSLPRRYRLPSGPTSERPPLRLRSLLPVSLD